jgi:NAD-dependent SIR2 family protein deacetylase
MLCDSGALPNFVDSQALASTDVLLVAAGAGFSADSGLPVYDSIASDALYASMGIAYSDLCNPLMMVERPELFFGFWGECCNLYKAAPLHAGYSLLNRWADEARQRLPAHTDLQPCWVYTSNVDGTHTVLSCHVIARPHHVITRRSISSLQRAC